MSKGQIRYLLEVLKIWRLVALVKIILKEVVVSGFQGTR